MTGPAALLRSILPVVRSLCGPNPYEHPRIPANTAFAASSVFGTFCCYSRIFMVLKPIGAPG
jgi:hypothetical protein